MIVRRTLLHVTCLILILIGCTTPSNGIKDIAYLNKSLYLCGWEQFQQLNLASGSIEVYPFRCGTMTQTSNGWIWVETGSSIEVFDGEEWMSVNIPREGGIHFFSETSDGLVWASSSLLSYFDSKTGQMSVVVPAISTPASTPQPKSGELAVTLPSKGRLGPVFSAVDGTIWYNHQFDGIVRWDRVGGQKQIWGPNDGFQGFAPIPTEYIQTRDGDIWIGTDTGVYRFHGDTWQTWVLPGEDPKNLGNDQGKFRRDQGDFRVVDMIEDHNGNIWVAFNRAGVTMWNGSDWRSVGSFEFPAGPMSIFEDSEGGIWIGALQQGVAKYQKGALSLYPGASLVTFLETPDHQLFGGGNKGLFLYNRAKDQWEPYP